MPPNPWLALADVLDTLAQTMRQLPPPAVAAPLPAPMAHDSWVTAKQFSDRHPAFPRNTIKNLLAARVANGLLERGIVKEVLQRKLVLHEARFLAWLLGETTDATLTIVPPRGRRQQHG